MNIQSKVLIWVSRHSRFLRHTWKWCESTLLVLLLIGGGAGLGYMLAYAQLHSAVDRIQNEHRVQLKRMEDLLRAVLAAVQPDDADSVAATAAQITKEAGAPPSCPVPPKKTP